MGKKKFIDKRSAATLQMVYRPTDHIGTNKSNQNMQIFQAVDKKTRGNLEAQISLAEIIQNKLNQGDFTTNDYDKKPIKKYKKAESNQHPQLPDRIINQLKNRDDLWINQLAKDKQKQQSNKHNDNNDDDDEWEDQEEWQEDEQDENNNDKLNQDLQDYRKVKFHPSIKMKKFDHNGLPLDDGYDYSQHIIEVDDQVDGDLVGVFYTNPNEMVRETFDIDYQPEEMNDDQKEVFEALKYEDDNNELEDDFVTLANAGEQCILPNQTIKYEKLQNEKIDHNDDYEGLEEEDDEGQYYEDDEELDSQQLEEENKDYDKESLEINSDTERQFEMEMNDFDENKIKNNNDKKQKKVTFDDEKQFNSILDDHLFLMKKNNKISQKQSEVINNNVDQDEKRQAELKQIKSKDYLQYLKEKFPNTDPKEFVLPKDVEKLTLEQDIALQNYLNRNESDSQESDEVIEERDNETILTRFMNQSQMSKISPEQLNMIKWQAKVKKVHKDKASHKEIKKQYKDDKQKKHEEEVTQLALLIRNKDETQEEKKQRKIIMKQIKNEKKDKKRVFNETLKTMNKQHSQQLEQNRQNTNASGISVIKVQ